jgi:hypothetical protein
VASSGAYGIYWTRVNVEKTIEFILGQQAKTEANLAELSAKQIKTDRQITPWPHWCRPG